VAPWAVGRPDLAMEVVDLKLMAPSALPIRREAMEKPMTTANMAR